MSRLILTYYPFGLPYERNSVMTLFPESGKPKDPASSMDLIESFSLKSKLKIIHQYENYKGEYNNF